MIETAWIQWNYAEFINLHGIEKEIDMNSDQDELDADLCQRRCSCSNCMDCIGLSWRDFF